MSHRVSLPHYRRHGVYHWKNLYWYECVGCQVMSGPWVWYADAIEYWEGHCDKMSHKFL